MMALDVLARVHRNRLTPYKTGVCPETHPLFRTNFADLAGPLSRSDAADGVLGGGFGLIEGSKQPSLNLSQTPAPHLRIRRHRNSAQ